MAPHGLYVCGTRAFQATLKDVDVQQQVHLYVTDILCMTCLQCLYPALATIQWQREYSSKLLKHSIVERILVFKR